MITFNQKEGDMKPMTPHEIEIRRQLALKICDKYGLIRDHWQYVARMIKPDVLAAELRNKIEDNF